MAFAELVGHERVRGLLSQAVASGRVPPALLFAGPEGIGKRALALAVGRALLCLAGGGEPCNVCAACSRSARGLHPDLMSVAPATNALKIDQIRDLVREVLGRPFEARARAFVIDDAHLMTEEASNALLKSLEEPPATSHVLLVTPSPQALLPTIRSRCQELRFSALPASALEEALRKRGLTPEEARLRAAVSGGSLGAALAFESEGYRALRELLLSLLEGLGRLGPVERMEAAESLADLEDPAAGLVILRGLLRDAVALREGVPPARLLNADVAPRLERVSVGPLGPRAAAAAEAVGETGSALRGNANPLLAMDLLLDALVPEV